MLRRNLTVGFCLAVLSCMPVGISAASDDVRLADAAMNADTNRVRSLLKQKADVNAAQADGTTALHWAAFHDDSEMAKLLIAAGANVNATTRVGGLTPMSMACTNGNAAIIEALLNAGVPANSATTGGLATSLMLAAASGNADAVKLLLDHGADVNATETRDGKTALMFAAAEDRAAVIKTLMKHGADARVTTKVVKLEKRTRLDDNGNPIPERRPVAPVGSGVGSGSVRFPLVGGIGAALAARNATATVIGGMTALLFAARDGRLNAARALMEGGADVNQVNAGDRTSPIVMAINNGHYELGKFLLDHGADPNLANEDGLAALYATLDVQYAPLGWTPNVSTAQEKVTHLELLKALLDHGANPNAQLTRKLWYRPTDHDNAWIGTVGTTPFWRATSATDLAAMRLLVAAGADPNAASAEGVTPLMVASGIGWSANFTVYVPESWMAAVQYCLELGADVNATDLFGYTALHGAAYRGDNELVKFLVEKGAKLNVPNKAGLTVTDMANGPVLNNHLPTEHPETVALLVKLGAPEPAPRPWAPEVK